MLNNKLLLSVGGGSDPYKFDIVTYLKTYRFAGTVYSYYLNMIDEPIYIDDMPFYSAGTYDTRSKSGNWFFLMCSIDNVRCPSVGKNVYISAEGTNEYVGRVAYRAKSIGYAGVKDPNNMEGTRMFSNNFTNFNYIYVQNIGDDLASKLASGNRVNIKLYLK